VLIGKWIIAEVNPRITHSHHTGEYVPYKSNTLPPIHEPRKEPT
tara:strand:- start:227 stop:358 length:132 start_codon:yes stop_codon:yes gene_type:complete